MSIEANGTNDFVIQYADSSGKWQKIYFKAADGRERDQWVQTLFSALSNAQVGEKTGSIASGTKKNKKSKKKSKFIEDEPPFNQELHQIMHSHLVLNEQ